MNIDSHILSKHENHAVYIDTNPLDKNGKLVQHYAALRCLECNKWLKWLSKSESQQLEQMGVSYDL